MLHKIKWDSTNEVSSRIETARGHRGARVPKDATLHGAWLKPAGADCAALFPGLGNDWAAPLSIEHKNDIVQENEDSRGGADP